MGLTDSTGSLVVSYTYDAWGKPLTVTGSAASTIGAANPLRYRGYVYDSETGLYYLGSRYYDPGVGRFINADTYLAGNNGVLQGLNLFAYCYNNPVNNDDSTGHWPKLSKILTAIAVTAVVIAAVAVTVATCGAAAPTLAATVGVIGGVSAGTAASATAIATTALVVAAASMTAATVIDAVEKAECRKATQNQTVYKLVDRSGETKYVGRTNNPERRAAEHARTPGKENLRMVRIATGLTIQEARVTEQVVISAYTIDNLLNARREIAIGNVRGFSGKIDNVINIFGGIVEDELLNLMER